MNDKIKNFSTKIPRGLVIGVLLVLVFYFIARKWFFIVLFMILNYLVLNFKTWFGVSFPIEVISLSTFITGYVYGSFESLIIVAGSYINLGITGRLNFHTFTNNSILVGIALISPLSRSIPVFYAGLGFLILRYVIDTFLNIVIFSNSGYIEKIPKRFFNVLFYVFFYFSFGELLVRIM